MFTPVFKNISLQFGVGEVVDRQAAIAQAIVVASALAAVVVSWLVNECVLFKYRLFNILYINYVII